MRIEHVALWVTHLDQMKQFYEDFFGARAGALYHNASRKFTSYFLSFDSGCRLELMHSEEITRSEDRNLCTGLAHFAVSVGSKEEVDQLTERITQAGYTLAGKPRTTGDGYYESVVLDPEGNRVEITV